MGAEYCKNSVILLVEVQVLSGSYVGVGCIPHSDHGEISALPKEKEK